MNKLGCESVRERIPDFVAERGTGQDAAEVAAHLNGCAECRREAELVRALWATRPAVPEGLAARIEAGVRVRRRSVVRPWWGLAAASVAALAVGIGVTSRGNGGQEELPGFVAEVEELGLWLADDGLIAGAPALDGLSEEALRTLLEEMGAGATGGAA